MINPGSSRILRRVPTSEGAPALQYIFFQNAMKVNIHLSPPMVGHWQIQGSALFDKTVFSGGFFRENISQKVDLHYMVFQLGRPYRPKYTWYSSVLSSYLRCFTIGQQIFFKIHEHREESV